MRPPSLAIAFRAPPCTHALLAAVALRVDKKIRASRCNLRVRWTFFDSSVGAIAFAWQALSGRAMETFIGALLYQCMQPRQLPLAGDVDGYGVCSLRARAEPGHSAQLCYRGTLGPDARVYGAGGLGRSRVGRTGKTACGLSVPGRKKCDLRVARALGVSI